MVDYGLTLTGLVIKRLEVIKSELEDSYRLAYGSGINLEDSSFLGQNVGINAERESAIWELIQSTYLAKYPATAEGSSLDDVVALTGIARLPATKSTVVARARGTATTLIPTGSIVSVSGSSDSKFVTNNDATIAAATNNQQKITFSSVPDAGTWDITFDGETTASLDYDDVAATIESALEALTNITSVTVTGDYSVGFTIEFDGADAGVQKDEFTTSDTLTELGSPVDVTVTVIDEGGAYIDIDCTSEETGEIQAPAGSLTVIETLVAGWDSVDNLEDADVGREIESDQELKIRRDNSLQQSKSGTVEAIKTELLEVENVDFVTVIENDTMTTDGDGRPPKSFESIVDGGDEDEIAQTIWESKPAGIEPYGSISKTVIDTSGQSHTIKFSRPIDVDIYVDVTVTEKPGITVTEANVKSAILAYGDSLNIGDDVIVYPDLLCSLSNLGLSDIVIKVGTAPSPTLDDNIPIDFDEIAKFASARIDVTIT